MAASGYTPILIYASGTATNVPLAANLTSSASGAELALNYADGKLYYKDSGGVVQVLASKAGNVNVSSFSAGTTGLTPSTATTGVVTLGGTLITSNGGTGLSSYTAGDLTYYASGTALSKLGIGTANQVLTSSGTAPQWSSSLTIVGLTATGAITLNTTTNNQSYTTTGAGTITISSGTAGTINNMSIGATTAAAGTFTSLTDSGNLTFTGTGNRITGDFTNATITNRTSFQTSTTNSTTGIYALPSGTSTAASWQATNAADPTNASKVLIATNGSTDVQLVSARNGTGTYLPLTFYTNGSEQMRLDTSGNVGIGTSSPASKLHVVGSFRQTGATVPFEWTVNAGANDYLKLNAVGYADNLVVATSAGNVGVGTNSPGAKLDVKGASGTTQGLIGTSANGMAFNSFDSGTYYATLASSNSTGLGFGAQQAIPLFFLTSNTERMRIDSSGNVGIGTSSPTEKLNVVGGNIKIDSSSRQIGYWEADAVHDGYMVPYNASGQLEIVSSFVTGALLFKTGTSKTERMRIDSSGNLLVGTQTSLALLTVSQSASSYTASAFKSNWSGDASNKAIYIVKYDNVSTTGQVFIQFTINQGATGSGQINANGANAAAFGTFSDRRLKENIVDLPPQLANIMALRPIEYDYIESEGGGHQIGFVAQEVQEVYPDLVGKRADGMLTLTDFNKNDARLIKAIQEQQALITQLTNRITTLENK